MNRLIVIFLFSMFCSKTFSFQEPVYCKYIDEIVSDYSKMLKTQGLVLNGSGGCMMDDIQLVDLSYQSKQKINLCNARRLYVTIIEEYVRRFNENERIRPYLHNYPFGIENVSISLSFEDCDGICMSDDVSSVFMSKNKMVFYENYNQKTGEYILLHKETFDEAVEKSRF